MNFFNTTDVEDLGRKISHYFSLDSIGVTEEILQPLSLESCKSSITINGKKYEVVHPWKHFPPDLSPNYDLSLGRLKSTLRFLQSKPDLLRQHNDIIEEQIKNKIIERVECPYKVDQVHYIPYLK